jgi:hypothetical protein
VRPLPPHRAVRRADSACRPGDLRQLSFIPSSTLIDLVLATLPQQPLAPAPSLAPLPLLLQELLGPAFTMTLPASLMELPPMPPSPRACACGARVGSADSVAAPEAAAAAAPAPQRRDPRLRMVYVVVLAGCVY